MVRCPEPEHCFLSGVYPETKLRPTPPQFILSLNRVTLVCIQVAKNPEHHGRMKHLDLCFYWLRGTVYSGVIALKYVPTAEMVADIMTMALPRDKVAEMRMLLGLRL